MLYRLFEDKNMEYRIGMIVPFFGNSCSEENHPDKQFYISRKKNQTKLNQSGSTNPYSFMILTIQKVSLENDFKKGSQVCGPVVSSVQHIEMKRLRAEFLILSKL